MGVDSSLACACAVDWCVNRACCPSAPGLVATSQGRWGRRWEGGVTTTDLLQKQKLVQNLQLHSWKPIKQSAIHPELNPQCHSDGTFNSTLHYSTQTATHPSGGFQLFLRTNRMIDDVSISSLGLIPVGHVQKNSQSFIHRHSLRWFVWYNL